MFHDECMRSSFWECLKFTFINIERMIISPAAEFNSPIMFFLQESIIFGLKIITTKYSVVLWLQCYKLGFARVLVAYSIEKIMCQTLY